MVAIADPVTTNDTPRKRRWIRAFLPRTLFGRSLVIIVTPVLLLHAISTWIFYDRHWDTMTNRLAFAVAGEIGFVIDQLAQDATPEARRTTLAIAHRTTDMLFSFEPGAQLPDKKSQNRGLLRRTLATALEQKVNRPFHIGRHGEEGDWYEIRVQMPDGVLSVMSPERRLFSSTTYIFLLWMIGSSIVLFAVAIAFMRNQIRPIRRLAIVAESFGKGRDVPSFRPEGAMEVRQAATAFQVMRERIQRQIAQRTDMLAGVSHDLRTPLTRMRLQLAMLPESPEIEDLKGDIAEMEIMIEGYLAFARGEGEEAVQPTNLDRLLNEVIGSVRRDGGTIELDLKSDLNLPVRPNAIRRCLSNLVGNAHRYAKCVRVLAENTGKHVLVTIDDDGPGIPAEKREDVFRPFFRLETSRNIATGGVGLGLSIARDIARSHGGDITLSDSPQGGLRAVLRLPV